MSTITEEFAQNTLRDLANQLTHSQSARAEANARLSVVVDALRHAAWDLQASRDRGETTIAMDEAILLLHMLYDVATLGKALPQKGGGS